MALKSRSSSHSGGYIINGSVGNLNVTVTKDDLTISTSVNPGGANPFQSDHSSVSGSLINSTSGSDPMWNQCPTGLYTMSLGLASMPAPSTSDFQRTMALTNPANPIINLPNVIWELKDVPDMIRQGGRVLKAIQAGRGFKHLIRKNSAVRDTAAANLAIEFGWKPFLNDLIAIGKLQSSMEKRRKMFEKLKTRGLRGRVGLGNTVSTSYNAGYPLFSVGGLLVTAPLFTTLSAERWGTIRWKINQSMPLPQTDGELYRHALGLTAANIPLAVWESLPWSWLTDWFVSVDQMLKASNRTTAIPTHVCVMTKRTTTAAHPGKVLKGSNYLATLSPGTKKVWRHERHPFGGVLPISASFPFLTGYQLSILGSLAIQRAPRGRR